MGNVLKAIPDNRVGSGVLCSRLGLLALLMIQLGSLIGARGLAAPAQPATGAILYSCDLSLCGLDPRTGMRVQHPDAVRVRRVSAFDDEIVYEQLPTLGQTSEELYILSDWSDMPRALTPGIDPTHCARGDVVFVRRATPPDDRTFLYRYSAALGSAFELFRPPRGTVRWPVCSPDRTRVAFISDQPLPGDDAFIPRLRIIELSTRIVTTLVTNLDSPFPPWQWVDWSAANKLTARRGLTSGDLYDVLISNPADPTPISDPTDPSVYTFSHHSGFEYLVLSVIPPAASAPDATLYLARHVGSSLEDWQWLSGSDGERFPIWYNGTLAQASPTASATVTGTPPTETRTITGTPPTETPTPALTGTPATEPPTVTGTPPTATQTSVIPTATESVTGTPPTATQTVTGTPPTPTPTVTRFVPFRTFTPSPTGTRATPTATETLGTSQPTLTAPTTATIGPSETATVAKPPLDHFLPIVYKFVCPDPLPDAEVALVIDASSSMNQPLSPGGPTKLDAAKQAATRFLDILQLQRDKAAVVAFHAQGNLVQPLTSDRGALVNAIVGIQPAPMTRINLGLDTARLELVGPRAVRTNRKAILLFTDGRSPGVPREEVLEAAARARDEGIIIFSLAYGADADLELLHDIAGTSSRLYLQPDASALARIYALLLPELPCLRR